MIEITTRLRRLYVQDGTNYVQEAADELERLRLRVKALESAITESLRIAGNWPEGAQAVLKDALPTLGEYAAQKDSK